MGCINSTKSTIGCDPIPQNKKKNLYKAVWVWEKGKKISEKENLVSRFRRKRVENEGGSVIY